MKCISPVWIIDKGTAGNTTVPCGRCLACRLNFASAWGQRLMNEKRFHKKSCFATLTYNDEKLPHSIISGNPTLVKKDLQDFLKRLRKNTGEKIRYFIGGEYGENYNRPHYHAIIFGMGTEDREKIEKNWQNGFVHVGNLSEDSANYVAKYCLKKVGGESERWCQKLGVLKEFALMSRKPGIGAKYVEKFGFEFSQRGFLVSKGNRVPIPRFYRNKLIGNSKMLLEESVEKYGKKIHEERLDRIKKEGYNKCDNLELLSRESKENELRGKLRLKVRRAM